MTSARRLPAPILLVEDKDSLRAMLRHALEAQGHAVVEARDQVEAVQALREARPAMVLSDLRLPQGDGFGVLRAAKELDPELPVVVMTALGGANTRKLGKFGLAHRGTIFLDEIGEMPLALQAKILRALEEKRFERVGGTTPLQVDVRVVAATNRNLKAAVAARQYREDLYFRLS